MAKRSATCELNHDNWNKEEEPEDSGTFKRASNDAIRNRVIKTARRRNPISNSGEGEKKGAFTSFQGFGKSSAPAPSFNFLSSLSNAPKTNGTTENQDNSLNATKTDSMFSNPNSSKESNDKSDEYFAKLKGLNESVAKWISRHVEENPLINLEPVFKDYQKYFDDLEKEQKTAELSPSKPIESVAPTFSFGTAAAAATTSTGFSFGSSTSKPTFSFGSANNAPTTQGASGNLSFASTVSVTSSSSFSTNPSPFSFGSLPKPAEKKEEDTNKNGVDDEDEPPKVEYNPVMEENSIYTTKCKLFIKKGDKYNVAGVGNLFLKNVKDSDKVQLIVRADTNLGTVFCNFILSESIPIQRLGTKDVMLVCLPLPDSEPPPTPILIRVKSSEDADQLLETLKKHKK